MKKLLCTVLIAAMLTQGGAAFAQNEVGGGKDKENNKPTGISSNLTEPTEPTKPTEPTEPTEPTKPTEPTEPTKIPPLPMKSETEFSAEMTLPVNDFKAGDTVYVDISLAPRNEIYAFEAELNFDSDKLEYKKSDIKYAEDDSIKIEKDLNGELLVAFTQVGDKKSEVSETVVTLEFSAKTSGNSSVTLKAFKAVFSDMTYCTVNDLKKYVNISVKSDEPVKEEKPSSGGGGGGGRGGAGGGSFSGRPTTTTGVEKPDEPKISEEPDEEKSLYSDVNKRNH